MNDYRDRPSLDEKPVMNMRPVVWGLVACAACAVIVAICVVLAAVAFGLLHR